MLAGCSSYQSNYVEKEGVYPNYDKNLFEIKKNPCERWKEIHVGISTYEIEHKFGEPYAVSNDGYLITWEYSCSDYYRAGRLFLEFDVKTERLKTWNIIKL